MTRTEGLPIYQIRMKDKNCFFILTNLLKLLFLRGISPEIYREKNCLVRNVIRGAVLKFLESNTKNNFFQKFMIYCFSKYFPEASIHFCIQMNQFSKHLCHSESDTAET